MLDLKVNLNITALLARAQRFLPAAAAERPHLNPALRILNSNALECFCRAGGFRCPVPWSFRDPSWTDLTIRKPTDVKADGNSAIVPIPALAREAGSIRFPFSFQRPFCSKPIFFG